jgi:hypothetical protein
MSVVWSRSCIKAACQARQMLYLILHEVCGWNPPYIAEALQRDQGTIRHGIARARAYVQTREGRASLEYVACQIKRAGTEARTR